MPSEQIWGKNENRSCSSKLVVVVMMADLRFEDFRDCELTPLLECLRICWTGPWWIMPLTLLTLLLPLLFMPLFRGTSPTIFANVSGLAGSLGIQLSGWARRMCSQMER